jgi:drug/metabolite transporter (DMT)-like permease
MFPFMLKSKRIIIQFEDFYKIFLLALTGITFNIGLYYLGLSLSQSINAPIIASMIPVFLIFGSIIFLHEKLKLKALSGTIVSLIGVGIIIFRPIHQLSTAGSILGNIYLLLSVISLVSYTILLKKFKLKYHSSTIIFWIFFIATITFFPAFIFENHKASIHQVLSFQGSLGILYGAILSSLVGQVFYNYSVKYLNANEIGIFTYLQPVVTALVAIPLLHEQITFFYLLGSLFVFLGLFIAELKLHYNLFHHHFNSVDDSWLESGP